MQRRVVSPKSDAKSHVDAAQRRVHTSAAADTLKETTRGVRVFFSINVVSKLATFAVNNFVIGFTTPVEQGVKLNVEVAMSSILFFSREAFRTAALRMNMGSAATSEEARSRFAHTINTGWLSTVIASVFLLCSYFVLFPYTIEHNRKLREVYEELSLPTVVALHFCGCLLEALTEPLLMASAGLTLNSLRSGVEGLALTVKIFAAAILVSVGIPPLIALGWSQVCYGGIFCLGYVYYYLTTTTRLGQLAAIEYLPKKAASRVGESAVWIPESVSDVIVQLQLESTMRLVLTEGEKVILSGVSELVDQGVYEVVSHLGSIVPRVLFKYIEEASLAAWSKLLSVDGKEEAGRLLSLLLHLVSMVGLVFVCWGPNYCHTLFLILHGRRWSETHAPTLLAVYCLYVSIMGINGIFEAFYRAAATGTHLKVLWKLQCAFSLVMICLSLFLAQYLEMGVYGIVLASMLVMLLRIAACYRFIIGYLENFSLQASMPRPRVVAFAVVCFLLTGTVGNIIDPFNWFHIFAHVAVGAVLLGAFALLVYRTERKFFLELRGILKP